MTLSIDNFFEFKRNIFTDMSDQTPEPQLQVPTLVIDNQNTILNFNSAFLNLCGYEKNDIIGRPIDTIFVPEDISNDNQSPIIAGKAIRKDNVPIHIYVEKINSENQAFLIFHVTSPQRAEMNALGPLSNINMIDTAFASLPFPTLIWKQLGNEVIVFLRATQSAYQLLKEVDLLSVSLEDPAFLEKHPIISKTVQNVLKTGKNNSIESHQIVTPTNKVYYFQTDFIKIAPDLVMLCILDRTEQRITELALKENERKSKNLLANLPGMAYQCLNDKYWSMDFISEGSVELTGYNPEDLVHSNRISYNDIILPEDRDYVWQTVQKAIQNKKPFEMQYRIKTVDQQIKWVWEHGRGIYSETNELLFLEGFVSDINERKKTEESEQEARLQTETLRQTLIDLTSELDLEQVLKRILLLLKKVIPYDSATLLLLEDEKFRVMAARGSTDTAQLGGHTYRDNNFLIEKIVQTKKAYIVDDAQSNSKISLVDTVQNVRGWMGVPLLWHGEIVGILTVDSYQPGLYHTAHAYLAETFANGAAIAIENARLYKEAQTLATIDSLTGLTNRRSFYALAENEFVRSKRYGHPLSLIMIDIDHFKSVNDSYGHAIGDAVLKMLTQKVRLELRQTDIFARFGGEEFMVLLPETDTLNAVQVAERIRNCIAETPVSVEEHKIMVTISLGIAEYDETCINLDDLLNRSDKALYWAKQIGRNRVRIWRDTDEK